MTDIETVIPEHPAKFPKKILDRLREILAVEADRRGELKVLDPFAGVGTIHELAEQRIETTGYELQPEWAAAHPDTICGSALELGSVFPPATFDCIVTSPCYGNRMADSHVAKDACKRCHGDRCEPGYNGDPANDGGPDPCSACGGTGLSKRNTYTHYLRAAGVEPVDSPDNAMVMHWGGRYRQFHSQVWSACHHVLRPGGLAVIDIKNHYVTVKGYPVEQRVIEFHLNDWLLRGYTLEEARRVPTKGLPVGTNHGLRTEAELILVLRRPATTEGQML